WAAARADFVVALYNPRSRERNWQLGRALEILQTYRPTTTPVAVARNVSRPDETTALTTIAELDPASVDMFTLVLVGNSQSYVVGGHMATPRGYTTGRQDAEHHEHPHGTTVGHEPLPAALYPIALTQLRGAPVVVIGGGAVGERKVRGLLAAGAAVRLISPEATPGLRTLANEGSIRWDMRPYQAGDLSPAAGPLSRLVFAATSERITNAQIARDADALGLLCNIADDPRASTFHLPAVHRGAGLTVAVSTAGESPARAARVRDALAAFLEQHTGESL
ncbi:MAG: NAD(P)-dependent oxidoreductase, partial [Roseiflexaceae bacterium]